MPDDRSLVELFRLVRVELERHVPPDPHALGEGCSECDARAALDAIADHIGEVKGIVDEDAELYALRAACRGAK